MTVDILDLNKIISNPFSFIQPQWSKSKRLHPQSTSSRRPSQPREQPPSRRSSRGEGEAARFQLPMQRSCSKVELIFQNTSAMTPSLPPAFHFIDPGSLDYSCCLSCTPGDCRKPRYCVTFVTVIAVLVIILFFLFLFLIFALFEFCLLMTYLLLRLHLLLRILLLFSLWLSLLLVLKCSRHQP